MNVESIRHISLILLLLTPSESWMGEPAASGGLRKLFYACFAISFQYRLKAFSPDGLKMSEFLMEKSVIIPRTGKLRGNFGANKKEQKCHRWDLPELSGNSITRESLRSCHDIGFCVLFQENQEQTMRSENFLKDIEEGIPTRFSFRYLY